MRAPSFRFAKTRRAGFVLALMLCAPAAPAFAQWYNYDGYQAYPTYPSNGHPGYPSYPAYPSYPNSYYDPVSPPAAAPYRGRPQSYSYDADPYDDADAPASRGHSYGNDDLEVGVNFNQRTAAMVQNPTNEPPGTIVIDTSSRHLYLVQGGGGAIQYGIGVGRQGFEWKGIARVGRKSEWPRWIPPKDMLKRRPDLPEEMDGGLENPLGARALYLFKGDKDTLFRIHGTNEPDSIGKAVSSGCIRMMNADVIDLYQRVGIGTKVVVM
ncbi:MAG TPA: L,D-transpeptidase [Methylocella sp.]|nr:L,D-transpeptidase [Methylocella sp.]